MFKNPLNLNYHLIFILADKMAEIFKMAAIEGLNYSFYVLHFTALTDFDAFGVYMYVNEPIDYEYTHSFLIIIICLTYLSNVKQKPQPLISKMQFICSRLIKYNDFSCP